MPRRSSTWLSVLITAALLAAVVAWHPAEQFAAVRRTIGLAGERALPAPAVRPRGGTFAFVMTQPGSQDPVGWDPCGEIHYSVAPAGAPAGGRELIDRALARASSATGLSFDDVGDTEGRPFPEGRRLFGPREPVVIGWGTADEYAELAGDVAGLGGAIAERGGAGRGGAGRLRFVSGGVVLDVEAFTAAAVAQRPRVMEAIVLHELAHVVGLGHVSEPMELMFANNTGQIDFGIGDLEGLARLGSLPCGG
ncbi:MAG: hypothetical protein LH477_16200 [Nocardioides sp.]|nr:hypothetical protein [Nocardioides sp.]